MSNSENLSPNSLPGFENAAAYLAAIVESSDDAIVSKNLMGIVTSWNRSAERIFGYTAEEMIGSPISKIIPPDRRGEEKEILARLRRGERTDHFETIRMRKDGRLINLSVTISPIRNEEGVIVGASKVARDITQQKENERKLSEQARLLERINSDLQDVTHIASHDLKEPLRGLIMKSTFLLEDYRDRLDNDGVQQLQSLIQLSQRSYQLINDLLNVSRVGNLKPRTEEIDPNQIVQGIGITLEELLRERKARIVVPQALPGIKGDETVFSQVLRNLISNGLTYNDKPEPVIEVGFLKEASAGGAPEENVFYVKDNGIGIPAHSQGEVFRLFKRLVYSKKYNPSGTGAGLTLVKKMIERCNGRIWLSSTPNEGTTFYFTLPAC